MIDSVKKKNKMQSGSGGSSRGRMFSGFHGDRRSPCRGAELSVSITKRLISIKVLVQEEVLEAFRSAGSCATEGQSKCVIAIVSQEPCLFNKLAKNHQEVTNAQIFKLEAKLFPLLIFKVPELDIFTITPIQRSNLNYCPHCS